MTNTQPQRILVVGPAWVGDMVMSQSLYRLLKQQHPHAKIDVLAPAWTFSVLKCMPEINDAIESPFNHGELKLSARFKLARELKQRQYDQAIVLQNSLKSALVPWLAGIPKRTGWRGEWRYGLLNDIRVLDKQQYPLMIEQFMALGLPKDQAIPSPHLYPLFHVTPSEQEAVLSKYHLKRSDEPVLAISAGAAFGSSKRWPETYYADIANEKIAAGWKVWLFGSPNDKDITDRIMTLTNHQCIDLAGQLELHETIKLLSLTSGLVTNDSGLMHVVAALNKPLVAIYGSTSPAFTPPLSDKATVLKLDLACQPCFKRECPLKRHECMLDLTPQQVLDAMATWSID